MPARLKSLELNGYKTFATNTAFEFAERVTAIVGPNGSGKSNIADAIRWVLGEQSYSLLRGRKTEDMIFSGSDQRPRAGMASATILFDNADGWLPIDFTEVAITRRAYRDGQNEYLINGQRVRLRDVSELLAKSGLAERTYTIIGQGLVDAALALRADERRRLFEEAAGIGLYRSRRDEALRRLDTTRRNLDRVRDILAELRPRLRSLERQARRSQQSEQIRADLRDILREWYGYHWHRNQKELVVAQQYAHEQEQALQVARQRQEAFETRLTDTQGRIHALRSQLNSRHRQLGEFGTQREAVSRELAVVEERRRSLGLQQQEQRSTLERLTEEIAYTRSRLEEARAEVARRETELAEAREQAAASARNLQALQTRRQGLEEALQAARAALGEHQARRAELAARQGELSARLERSAARATSLDQSLAEAENTLQVAEQRLQARQGTLAQADQARQKAEAALAAMEEQIKSLEAERRRVSETLGEGQAQVARLAAQAEVLDQAEKALVGYASGARLLLREQSLPGVRQALGASLQVPPELEAAIAAALGDFVDAVLVERDEEIERALGLLQDNQAKAALLPLQGLKPPLRLSPPRDVDCLGLASDLVQVPAELRPAIELLLGRVLVVRDRAAARRILAGQPEGTRAATLAGEVFHLEGPIVAGAEDRRGVLGRPRQRRQIATALEEAHAAVETTNASLRALDERLMALISQRDLRSGALQEAQKAEDQARAAVRAAEMALEQARHQLAWLQEQRAGLETEREQTTRELATLEAQAVQLQTEGTRAQQALREQVEALGEVPLEEVQSQAAYWELQAQVAERLLGDTRARLEERDAALEQVTARREEAETRLQALAEELQTLGARQATLRERERELARQIEALSAEIQPEESELFSVEANQEKLQAEAALLRQALTQAERNYTQAQITLARRQEALETLRHRIEDDFGLVAFEYVDEISGPTPLPLEGMVEQLPVVETLSPDIEASLQQKRAQLRRIGPINPEAQMEYTEVQERFTFLTEQVADLEKAEADLQNVIAELDELMQREFRKTFDAVAVEFRQIFTRLFGGGSARLVLTEPEDLTHTGIDIDARLPGRRTQGLSLLSGGERSLTATALIFSLLKVSPTPFCVLDEVDAMLDEANVGRFREMLREFSEKTQFILITHNRNTVQVADVIYGVTMGHDSTSQILSLRLDQVAEVVPA